MLEDDRVNKTYYTYRNEARLRQAEIDREIALKKLEIEKIKVEQEEKRKNKNRRLKIIVAIILAILVFVLSLSGYLLKDGSLTLTAMMIFPILCILGITSLGNNDKKYFEKLSNLVNSIYHDELELIVMLDDIERNRIQSKKGPQIFNFMMK